MVATAGSDATDHLDATDGLDEHLPGRLGLLLSATECFHIWSIVCLGELDGKQACREHSGSVALFLSTQLHRHHSPHTHIPHCKN